MVDPLQHFALSKSRTVYKIILYSSLNGSQFRRIRCFLFKHSPHIWKQSMLLNSQLHTHFNLLQAISVKTLPHRCMNAADPKKETQITIRKHLKLWGKEIKMSQRFLTLPTSRLAITSTESEVFLERCRISGKPVYNTIV